MCVYFKTYYLHKLYFSYQNPTFCDSKYWLVSGSASTWIIGLAPWIRIRIETSAEINSDFEKIKKFKKGIQVKNFSTMSDDTDNKIFHI